ncbi:MAG TPA: FAD-dependent oxidoreductase [Gemmatimonadales bacterium]|nr:FAD-dependent oxidoreductase [Gemmatimonadales bacterium]
MSHREGIVRESNYLVVGGGMTADAAVRGIRELDRTGAIAVVGAEPDAPYSRPPLTKGLWKGDAPDSIWRKTGEVEGVTLHLGERITALNMARHRATSDRGNEFTFDKVLLATGCVPRRLPSGGDGVNYFRTLADYHTLRRVSDAGGTVAVVGGGFIGSEAAAALALQGRKVTLLFPEAGIGARIFPADLATFLVDFYRGKGVDVRAGEQVASIMTVAGRYTVTTKSGFSVIADAVVAGIGVVPDVSLAEAAGCAVDDGIVVDEHLRTSQRDIYAAGDVARFHSPQLGRLMRVEHEDNALTMGKAAGRSMAGDITPYHHLPFFYSDLFELGYEAVGDTDPRHEVFADWKTPFREGVVYYLADGRVRGVLLWNTWGQVDAARGLIAEPGPFTAADLKGRLPAAA